MSSFVLKIIAIISMFIDHSNYLVNDHITFLNYIGRLAFPIFAFQITIGYQKTKDLKKYMSRLLVLAIISQVPIYLYFNNFNPNVIFILLLGLICINIYNYKKIDISLRLTLILCIMILSEILQVEYGIYGISLIMIFYYFKDRKLLLNSFSILIMALYHCTLYYFYNFSVTDSIFLFIFSACSLLFINLYNGKQGYRIKYLFYIFYPLHLLILYLIKICIK